MGSAHINFCASKSTYVTYIHVYLMEHISAVVLQTYISTLVPSKVGYDKASHMILTCIIVMTFDYEWIGSGLIKHIPLETGMNWMPDFCYFWLKIHVTCQNNVNVFY